MIFILAKLLFLHAIIIYIGKGAALERPNYFNLHAFFAQLQRSTLGDHKNNNGFFHKDIYTQTEREKGWAKEQTGL